MTEQEQEYIIDDAFILREDLREFLFKEDSEGNRYRERIWEQIEKFGVANWFKAKGYPTDENSIWLNRYTKSASTLGEQITKHLYYTLEKTGGYLLWENWLPKEKWNDSELHLDYKEGTKEYAKRIEEENANRKKHGLQPKGQTGLFGELKKEVSVKEVKEVLDEDDEEIDEDDMCDGCGYPYNECKCESEEDEDNPTELPAEEEKPIKPFSNDMCIGRANIKIYLKTFAPQNKLGEVPKPIEIGYSPSYSAPNGKTGSWSGGGWDKFSTNEEIFDVITKFFKQFAKPYYHEDTPFTSLVKMENVEISFNDDARDFLLKQQFDFNKLDEAIKEIRNSQNVTPEVLTQTLAKGNTFKLMEKSMEETRSICWAIRGYFEKCAFNRTLDSSAKYYLERLKEFKIPTEDLNALKTLYDSKARLYNTYYKKVYFMRWNKEADEEYANV